MLAKRLHSLLIPQAAKPPIAQVRFWLSLSLTFAAIFGLLGLQKAFSSSYVVQDDARQHVFWMERFLDPQVFPNDWIADYFESVAPWGYHAFYHAFTAIGIDPLVFSKLLPPVLGLIATFYGFRLSLQLLPIPFTGFLSCWLLNLVFWMHEDLASATPRAFMLPFFLAFLDYLLRRSIVPCVVLIVLEGLFYPQFVFVFAGLLLFLPFRWNQIWHQRRLRFSLERRDYWLCGLGLIAAFLILLPYALISTPFDPVVPLSAAKQLPDFYEGGRNPFFSNDPLFFWFTGIRSGIFPTFQPFVLGFGFLLPILLCLPTRLPLTQQITRKTFILLQITLTALGLFFAAHLLLFKLHLPSRYTAYTLRFTLAYAAAIALTLIFDAGLRWLAQSSRSTTVSRSIVWGFLALLMAALLLNPSYEYAFMRVNYKTGRTPQLYEFFAQQPKDIMIASLAQEIDFVPTFSHRSILVGREYAIPYHAGYIDRFRERANDLIRAQYSLDRGTVRDVIQRYGIDFWVLSQTAFKPATLKETWIRQYPQAIETAARNLKQGTPALAKLRRRCAVLREGELVVLEANCILQATERE